MIEPKVYKEEKTLTKSAIPVTLISGFLGAGKTTLLNHLFKTVDHLRFAVIENEFGYCGIDGLLISKSNQLLFELTDGCICCTVQEELVETFKTLIRRRHEFDHIIIETTGLAEPSPILKLFDLPWMMKSFFLNGVVTVVDTHYFSDSLNESHACQEQVIYADLLIMNKIDEIQESKKINVENQLRQLNPLAQIIQTSYSKLNVDLLLSLRSHKSQLKQDVCTHSHKEDHSDSKSLLSSDTHHHVHPHHTHSFDSVSVECTGVMEIRKLDLWLGRLARNTQIGLLRMKGVIAIPNDPRRFIFQGVRNTLDVWPDRLWESETKKNQIVFIGRNLQQETLQNEFVSCLAELN